MLQPILTALPDEQRRLWTELADVPDSFVLYGGTALALRLGHRSSVDFGFFSSASLDHDALFSIPFVAHAEVLQREPTALTMSVTMNGEPVKVSFFGTIDIGRVGDPDQTEDQVLWVASLLDLFGTKLKVLLQRIAARDYLDHCRDTQKRQPVEGRPRRRSCALRKGIPSDGSRQGACVLRRR